MGAAQYLEELNAAQRAAVEHGVVALAGGGGVRPGPLLVIAGAGSGKTKTLAHRVAHLIASGADPERVLLLTFTRRAAAEMARRARRIATRAGASSHASPGAGASPSSGVSPASSAGASLLAAASPVAAAGAVAARGPVAVPAAGRLRWAGTFHAVANRLLRLHAEAVGLTASFTVLDRSDAADLMDLVRDELGLSRRTTRFPRKETCLAIYSHAVNARRPLEEVLATSFPWCAPWADELRRLFGAYVEAKQERQVLDYDDLLLYWHHLMAEPALALAVRRRFDHVLVDEYQDTNALQEAILLAIAPDGHGLTVVGDDAQSIYSFRAATVRNILDFPGRFDPPATVVALEQSYRSTQPILAACNAVIGLSRECFPKKLFSERASRQRPVLVSAEDEACQVDYVVERILESREAGVELRRQAVLFRAAHHSDALELELARRDIPFVKYGGLKFLEAAHVKDLLCVLRWAENPRDSLAAFRVVQLLPGLGPKGARGALEHLRERGFELGALGEHRVPAAAAHDWPSLCALLVRLADPRAPWPAQLEAVRGWYRPHLERRHDDAALRARDLDELERAAAAYPSRERFLTELTLDPPAASGDEAGVPQLDEDYLILSTIHSAKGQEWDVVYVLDVVDGRIPSDMATGRPQQVEEERRLLYVAMTRARDELHLIHPLRFFVREQHRHGDRHVLAPRSRFLPDSLLEHFERRTQGRDHPDDAADGGATGRGGPRVDVGARLREMWG